MSCEVATAYNTHPMLVPLLPQAAKLVATGPLSTLMDASFLQFYKVCGCCGPGLRTLIPQYES